MATTKKPHWLAAAGIVALAALRLIWIWHYRDDMTQQKVIDTGLALGATAILLFCWAMFDSGFTRRMRLRLAGGCVATLTLCVVLFEPRGVSGDLVPLIGWRFTRDLAPDRTLLRSASDPHSVEREYAWRDSPQFLGPSRDATWRDIALERDLTAHPPRLVWKRVVGSAWSGFAIRGRDAITQEQDDAEECVTCYDVETGQPKWVHAEQARFDVPVGGVGPRATPTITADRVYAFGATGRLCCLDRDGGHEIWTRDVLADHGARLNEWGMSGSPLLFDGKVIVCAGGPDGHSLVAYDADDGSPVWSAGDDRAGYASPELATLCGELQILALNGGSIAGHDAHTGVLRWSLPWPDRNPNVAQPRVVAGDRVLVSSGYGVGCGLLQITRSADDIWQATSLWKTLSLKAKFANFVTNDGFAYGLDDGILVCVDLASGERRWKGGRYGHGQVLLIGDALLITGEFGELYLVAATPERHQEWSQAQLFDDKTWNPPAFAPPYLFVRTENEAACYELSLTAGP